MLHSDPVFRIPRSWQLEGENVFAGRTVLITGGTGSFGAAFTKYLLKGDARQIRIFSRDEAKQDAMRHAFRDDRLSFYLGDIRDQESIVPAMKGVDFVFHAAALKQVPACELFPEQAVKTNVIGSRNVLQAADALNVERVVCLSTDKAVYPINVMGMTKALMEKTVQASARRLGRGPILCTVRYGNVLNSRGSVVPVFIEQLKRGRPITVTAPEMTRFLLTLDDAIGLIEMALRHGAPGDTFVRKSPATTVQDMALAIKDLYRSDVPVQVVGVRPGEKFHETLCTFSEIALAEETDDFFRIGLGDQNDLTANSGRIVGPSEDYTSDRARRLGVAEIRAILDRVPEIAEDARTYLRLRASA